MSTLKKNQRDEIYKRARASIPRDDLRKAFAGDENNGPAHQGLKSYRHSTNVKSRRNRNSRDKTPKV